MVRHHWTPRMLARHVSPAGMFGRPTLAFRFRADGGPPLPPNEGYCYRPYELAEAGWPDDWVALFQRIDSGVFRRPDGTTLTPEEIRDRTGFSTESTLIASWKYVDVCPAGGVPDSPRHITVFLRGYSKKSCRPLLPTVAGVIMDLQAKGVRVEVR